MFVSIYTFGNAHILSLCQQIVASTKYATVLNNYIVHVLTFNWFPLLYKVAIRSTWHSTSKYHIAFSIDFEETCLEEFENF